MTKIKLGPVQADWMDPKVKLPPEGHGIIVMNSDGEMSLAEWHASPWPYDRWVAWLKLGRKLGPFSFIDKSPKIGGEYLHTLQEDTATSVILCAEKWIRNAADEYCRLERGEP